MILQPEERSAYCSVCSTFHPVEDDIGDRINLSVLVFSSGIAAFTFSTVHTTIPLEILVIKRIYELFYAI